MRCEVSQQLQLGVSRSCKGTLTESLTGTLISLNWNTDGKFNGNLDQSFSGKNNNMFDCKGGIWKREMKPRTGKGKRGGRKTNGRREGYKKRIIIFFIYPSNAGYYKSG